MAEPHTDLPIDASDPMATQSRQMLMIAHDRKLINYRMPIDMTSEAQVAILTGELGPDITLPPEGDQGVYYFLYVLTERGENIPVLIPEGEVRPFIFALALLHSRDMARHVLYRASLLP